MGINETQKFKTYKKSVTMCRNLKSKDGQKVCTTQKLKAKIDIGQSPNSINTTDLLKFWKIKL